MKINRNDSIKIVSEGSRKFRITRSGLIKPTNTCKKPQNPMEVIATQITSHSQMHADCDQ